MEINNGPFFYALPRNNAKVTVQDVGMRQECTCPGLPRPVKRYQFTIFDHTDGQTKILWVGEAVAKKIFEELAKPSPIPRRNWFMRLLEWLGVVKPLFSEPLSQDFKIGLNSDGQYPRYDVRRLG